MRKNNSVPTGQILTFLEEQGITAVFHGAESMIQGVSSFYRYEPHTVTWLKNYGRYQGTGMHPEHIALLVAPEKVWETGDFGNVLACENPKAVFYRIVEKFFCEEEELISQGSVIHPGAQLGEGVAIGSNCVIEKDVVIGAGTRIYHNVVIRHGTRIGKNCVIKSGTVIGGDGFGHYEDGGRYYRVPHLGNVTIGDCVELGANNCVDRGTMDDTVIGDGTKTDNLCHIAHNDIIGKNVQITAGVTLSGSVTIGDGSYLAPGTVVKNQLTIGKKGLMGIGAVVINDTEESGVYIGVPAKKMRMREEEDL